MAEPGRGRLVPSRCRRPTPRPARALGAPESRTARRGIAAGTRRRRPKLRRSGLRSSRPWRRRREWWRDPLWLLAIGPGTRLPVGPGLEYVAPFARHMRRILRREIHEHRGERGVVLHVVETDLVVRVAIGVPGVAPIVPVARAQSKAGRAAGDKRRVIGAATARRAGKAEFDVAGDVGGDAREIGR